MYLMPKIALTLCLVILCTPLSRFLLKVLFEREPVELHKQTIPHFLALVVRLKISQAQLCSSIREDHTTFLVKNTLFKRKGWVTAP